ncbi:MAG: HmuY family protein [Chloroflexi bacterium]|nr:HmuY family protein [Chloroflexota bacterium]
MAVGLAAVVAAMGLLVVGWLAWAALQPKPAGFAPGAGGGVTSPGQPSNGVQYTVDARNRRDWAYFNFRQGSTVSTSQDSLDWDLAFRRTDLLTNSGDANPRGQGGALDLQKVPLAEAIVPDGGYLPDRTHEDRGLENPALHKWYSYNWTTHIITSKEHTYALRTATGEVVLLTFISYYCDDGSSGCVTFSYTWPTDRSPSGGVAERTPSQ